MKRKQLWNDEKIESEFLKTLFFPMASTNAGVLVGGLMRTMRNEYEAQLTAILQMWTDGQREYEAELKRLNQQTEADKIEIQRQTELITRLRTRWQPIAENNEIMCNCGKENCDASIWVDMGMLSAQGADGDLVTVEMPDNIRLCRRSE